MACEISPKAVYRISDDIVSREIEKELIIVPLTDGIGELDDGLYTLNETARAFWECVDGSASLGDIAVGLAERFEAPGEKILADVLGLAMELARLKMIVSVEEKRPV
jgi:hypothetical protein